MNTYSKVALSAFCAFGGAVIATLVTVGVWNIQIEPRAFQCWDEMGWLFNNYWLDINVHRQAGDKISPGWTWEEIQTVRRIYIGVFFVIWVACSVGAFRLISRPSKRADTSREAAEIIP